MRNFDYLKLKSYKWDNETILLISKIHEYKGKQELFLKQKPATLDKLVETAKIQSVEGSNNIEGIRTTNTRLKQIVQDKVVSRNRNEEEIAGYRDVLNVIHENFDAIPIKSSYILQLHKILYQHSGSSIGGRFKNTQNLIFETLKDGTQVIRFTPLDPFETPMAIEQICESYNKVIDSDEIDPLILIPAFIIDFLCIHPFNDGNGRMSRLLTTLLLYRAGYVVGKYVSIEHRIDITKIEYYSALKKSDQNWSEEKNDITPFVKYILGVILACYRDFESRINVVDGFVPSIDLVREAVNKKIGKFSKSDIQELVPQIKNTSIVNALGKLIEEGLIEKHGVGKATYYIRKN